MKLTTDQTYHVFNKSIAGYKVFNGNSDFHRMLEISAFYQSKNLDKFSVFNRQVNYKKRLRELIYSDRQKQVEIIAYCFMPTHFHFVLKQVESNGTSDYLNSVLNSYTRYFNTKYQRKGPLWQGRTKKILVESDEQLLHLTRYIHLNPTTSYLVDKPEDWCHSSYNEYINSPQANFKLCKYDDTLDINVKEYRDFVEDTIDYQRNLKRIKDLTFE
jgi:putative transposase